MEFLTQGRNSAFCGSHSFCWESAVCSAKALMTRGVSEFHISAMICLFFSSFSPQYPVFQSIIFLFSIFFSSSGVTVSNAASSGSASASGLSSLKNLHTGRAFCSIRQLRSSTTITGLFPFLYANTGDGNDSLPFLSLAAILR